MDTISESNTTFEERLVARLAQMGEHGVTVTVSPEQKARNASAARERYANRTDAQKDIDRSKRAHYRLSEDQKARDAVTARERYANRTEAQKDEDRRRGREQYQHTHPYSRLNKEDERIAMNKRIEDSVKKASSQGE